MESVIFKRIKKAVGRKRGISFWLLLLATILAAAMLVVYTKTGISTFTPTLSGKVRILLGVSMIVGALLCFFEVKNGKYVFYLLLLWTWLEFLLYEASYISNVVVGIDGNSFSSGFILTALCGLLSCVFALISAIVQKQEFGSGDAKEEK